ncbi:MAG TPA: BON domain-containing protein [Candidatus Limnocylindrales bacterium]
MTDDPQRLVDQGQLPGTEDRSVPGEDLELVRPDDERPEGVPAAGEVPAIGDVFEADDVTDTEVYEGDLASRGAEADGDRIRDPLLSLELQSGETDDPNVAAEEGLTYVAPMDPPISGTQADGDPMVAAGFASSALDEPYDESHHSDYDGDEGEMAQRVRDALRADAETTGLADSIAISVVGDRVILTGLVDDIDDADAAVAVAARASGVSDVIDRLEVVSVDSEGLDPRGRSDEPAN